MQKQIYLLRGLPFESYTDFNSRMLSKAREVKANTGVLSLRVNITTAPPPAVSVIPFKKSKAALISIIKEDSGLVSPLIEASGFAGAYHVEEAIPVAYEKDWPDEEPSPGICLLTLFHRKPGIDHATFIDRWHNSHTPLSLRLHPLWNYNRNVVRGIIADPSEWFDGIVEEHFRTRAHLLNPFKFFGPPHRIVQNMLEVYTDTRSFIDYKRIETYLSTEYHLVSGT